MRGSVQRQGTASEVEATMDAIRKVGAGESPSAEWVRQLHLQGRPLTEDQFKDMVMDCVTCLVIDRRQCPCNNHIERQKP